MLNYVQDSQFKSFSLITKAINYATTAHEGQVRKYTHLPYITHCLEVADCVNMLMSSSLVGKRDTIVAALLHDTVEDTTTTLEDIHNLFGPYIHKLVYYVTDISTLKDGNRAVRKKIDAEHYAQGDYYSQFIKMADLISNTQSIVAFDPGFAKIYLSEKEYILSLFDKGSQIYPYAERTLKAAQKALQKKESSHAKI